MKNKLTLSWRIPDDFTSEETDGEGNLLRLNDKGKFHSLYSPALERVDGNKYWYRNGEPHRIDGPAVERPNGDKSWYLNGDFIGRSENGFTDEDFENYKREHNIL